MIRIDETAELTLTLLSQGSYSQAKTLGRGLYELIAHYPLSIQDISNYRIVGQALGSFLGFGIEDIDLAQNVVSLAYFFTSRAIMKECSDANLYKDRLT